MSFKVIIQTKTLLRVKGGANNNYFWTTPHLYCFWNDRLIKEHIESSQYDHEGQIQVFWGLNVVQFWVPSFRKRIQSYEYIRYQNDFFEWERNHNKLVGEFRSLSSETYLVIYQKPLFVTWLPSPPGTFYNFQISQVWCKSGALKLQLH